MWTQTRHFGSIESGRILRMDLYTETTYKMHNFCIESVRENYKTRIVKYIEKSQQSL